MMREDLSQRLSLKEWARLRLHYSCLSFVNFNQVKISSDSWKVDEINMLFVSFMENDNITEV